MLAVTGAIVGAGLGRDVALVTDGQFSGLVNQGISAELIADRYGFSREDLDAYGLQSQQRAARARDEGRFDEQIHPVSVRRKRENVDFDTDEGLRETTVETLSGLKPAFQEGGTVTAGNRHDRLGAVFTVTLPVPARSSKDIAA